MLLRRWCKCFGRHRCFTIASGAVVIWLFLTVFVLPLPSYLNQLTLHMDVESSDEQAINVWDTSLTDDRINAQINHIPKVFKETKNVSTIPMKVIFDLQIGHNTIGAYWFHRQNCLVRNCMVTSEYQSSVDAIIIKSSSVNKKWKENRNSDQIWIYYTLESPYHTSDLQALGSSINWTATYRRDSTLVSPYKKWIPFERTVGHDGLLGNQANYAKGKTKLVAWFVSNCHAANSRLEYAKELGKFIQVDIYGACGTAVCPKDRGTGSCSNMLKTDYKFYLSFENSNCRDYITEKFFVNGLTNDLIPVVMGAPKIDYLSVAPPGSFIHVDDFDSPKSLAKYLHHLDKNDYEYNQYFRWKGSGKYESTKFWCRLCAMLHDEKKPRTWVNDIEKWWRPGQNKMCHRNGSWNAELNKNVLQDSNMDTFMEYD